MAGKFSIVAYLGLKSKEFMSGLKGAKGATGSAMGKMGGLVAKFGKAAALALAVAAAAMAAAIIKFSVEALQAFAEFEKGMNEVYTLLPGISKRQMGKLEADVLSLSREMGILTTDMVPALYQAVSAGVPKDNVIDFMRVASKAAIAGVTTLETAVDGLTSVVNAYGKENLSVEKAADIFFTTIRLGKTNFEQLAASLYNITPVAAAVGVSFEDVGAAIAALTAQGVPTAQATTQIRSALLSLTAPSEKARGVASMLGLDFDKLTKILAQPGGLKTAMELVIKATGGNMDKLKALMGRIEGVNGLVALSQNGFQSFTDAILAQGNSLGAYEEAYKTMNQGLSREWDLFKAGIKATVIEAGAALAPIAQEFVPLVKILAKAFQDVPFDKLAAGIMKWMGEVKKELRPILDDLILAWRELVRAAGPIFAMFGGMSGSTGRLSVIIQLVVRSFVVLIKIISAAFRVFVAARTAIEKLSASNSFLSRAAWVLRDAFTSIMRAILGVIAPGSKLIGKFDEITRSLGDLFRWLENAAYELSDFVQGFGPAQEALYSWAYVWKKVKATIMGVFADIVEALYNAVHEIINTFNMVWDSIADGLDAVWNNFKETFPGLANIIEKVTAGMREKFGKVFDFIKGKLAWLAKIYSKFTGEVIELEEKMAAEVTKIEKDAENERVTFRRSARSKRSKEWENMVKERRDREMESLRIEKAIEHERVMAHRRALLSMGIDTGKVMKAELADLEDMLKAKGEAGRQAMARTTIANEAQLARMKNAMIALNHKEVELKKLSGEELRKLWMKEGQRGRNAYNTLLNYERKLGAAKKAEAEGALGNLEHNRTYRNMTYAEMMKEAARRKQATKDQARLDKEATRAYQDQMKKQHEAVEAYLMKQGKLKFKVYGMEIKANNAREALEKYNHIQRLRRKGEWKDKTGQSWKFELEIDKERREAELARQTLNRNHMAQRNNALQAWQRRSNTAIKAQRTQMNQVAALAGRLPTGNIKIELGTPEHLGKVLATANVLLSSIDRTLKGKFVNQ
jgi:TP901 family phage tail tape measure protein